VQRPVDADLGQVETNDPVERGLGLGFEPLEYSDPLVASGSQRCVGHLVVEDRFDVHPRRAGDKADQEPPEAQPIRDAGPMTTPGMGLNLRRQQRLDRLPDDVHHLGIERAHDVSDPPPGRPCWSHPKSKSGQPGDRWMVTYPRGS
jgi:hypothetical protein